MIQEHTVETVEKGDRQENIDICTNCKFEKCNGDCAYFRAQAKKLRQRRVKKKKVVVY